MQKVTPFLWFDGQAEEAMHFYVGIFQNSKVLGVNGPPGQAFSVTFELDGQKFHALNGGPQYTFSPAVSFLVNCETQSEVDDLWSKLTAGGSEEPCGWLKDRYGLSWQIVPSILGRLIGDKDREKAGRAIQAMLKMKKLDIAGLQRAFDGS
ncbi:MAG: VOC family protein [Gemmatimonadales bacterium]